MAFDVAVKGKDQNNYASDLKAGSHLHNNLVCTLGFRYNEQSIPSVIIFIIYCSDWLYDFTFYV